MPTLLNQELNGDTGQWVLSSKTNSSQCYHHEHTQKQYCKTVTFFFFFKKWMVLHTVYAPEWQSRGREMRSISPESQAGKWESRSQSRCQGSNSTKKTLLCPVVQAGGEAEPQAALKEVGFSNDLTNTCSLPKYGTELCWTPPGTHEPLSQGAHESPKTLSQSKQS